ICPDTNILVVEPLSNNQEVRTYRINEPITDNPRYEMCGLRASYYKLSKELYNKAGKCEELIYWDNNTKYCGSCGGHTIMDTPISKRCVNCGKEFWPQLATAIIVLVRKGDEILLVHAKNFRGNFYGLVAGFVETGETLEEAVVREVREETGLEITNIRYYGSQPWPYPCGLMIGFNADYVKGNIKLQESELTSGAWFSKDNLPQIPEPLSIARKLIDNWLDNG
ncbi:MAG: NAD(+) diphosphatase, partial [Prevotella sp.]